MTPGLADPAGREDPRAGNQADLDRPPQREHLQIQRVDRPGQVPDGGEAGLEHQAGVARRVERQQLRARGDLGPDRVGLVGVEDAHQVDVQIHQPRHDGRLAGIEPRSPPAVKLRGGHDALDALPTDEQPHVGAGLAAAPIPEPAGQDEELVRYGLGHDEAYETLAPNIWITSSERGSQVRRLLTP